MSEKLNKRVEDDIGNGGWLHTPKRWLKDGDSALPKRRVYEELEKVAEPVGMHTEHVRRVLAFAGCSEEVSHKICATGFAILALLDPGYFGTGAYLTLHSAYAAMYAAGSKHLAQVAVGTELWMIAADVFVANTYPVTRGADYKQKLFQCDHYGSRVGVGSLAGYVCSFSSPQAAC